MESREVVVFFLNSEMKPLNKSTEGGFYQFPDQNQAGVVFK